MKKIIITALILTSYLCFSQSDEWTYLFDGKSFNGWHQYNSDSVGSQWSITNGELIFTNNRDSKQDLVTVNEYSNFELSIEWNISKGGNSGIFYGVQELPDFDEAFMTGTPFCMLPVTSLNSIKIGNGKIGPIFQKLINKWSENENIDIIKQIKKWDLHTNQSQENIVSPYSFKR